MNKILFISIFFVLGNSVIFAQDKKEILKLDTKSFEQLVEKSSLFVNNETWEFLYKKADIQFDNEDYLAAQQISEKAKVVGDKINDLIIKFKSNYQLAKIEVFLQNNNRANELFNLSREALLSEAKRIAPRKIEIETENGLFYFYWSLIYSNPDQTNPHIDTALSYLANAYRLNDSQTDSRFDEPFVRVSLQIARCFGLKGNHLAKLLWIENAKLRLTNKNSKFNSSR